MSAPFKTGFVGIFGPTNAGKSTLVNALVGNKVSIVSEKVQTTYHSIKGIRTTESSQIVFLDTPGFQTHREKIAQLLNQVADRNLEGLDAYLWVFDASAPNLMGQIEALKPRITGHKPSTLILNKVDKVSKLSLLPLMDSLIKAEIFQEIIPISAKKKDGIQNILTTLEERIPEGKAAFPEDIVTDRPMQFLVTEYIREKIYEATRQEIPYACWVEVEKWDSDEKVPTIHAKVHVDTESKKGILIGKKGEMLKRIGSNARKDIENLIGNQICLKLFVHVYEDWKKDARVLETYLELG